MPILFSDSLPVFFGIMQYEAPQNAVPQRVAIHRFISLKDYGIIAAVTLISLPLGWYFGTLLIRFTLISRQRKWKICSESNDVYYRFTRSGWRLFDGPR